MTAENLSDQIDILLKKLTIISENIATVKDFAMECEEAVKKRKKIGLLHGFMNSS